MDARGADGGASSSSAVEHTMREFVSTYGGEKRAVHRWASSAGGEKPSARVAIVHGYGVHCMFPSLKLAATALAQEEGFIVFGLDLAGHGRSEGLRGYIPSPEAMLSDMFQFLEEVRRDGDDTTPVFLLGNSMGGAISLLYSISDSCTHKIDGIALLAPMLSIPNVSSIAGTALVAVDAIGLGPLSLPSAVSGYRQGVTENSYKDPELRQLCAEDELGYNGNMRVGTAASCLSMCNTLQASFDRIRTPYFIVMGDADATVDPQEPRVMMDKTVNVAACDKRLEMVEGGLHGLLAEPIETRSFIINSIKEWILMRCATNDEKR